MTFAATGATGYQDAFILHLLGHVTLSPLSPSPYQGEGGNFMLISYTLVITKSKA